jgi:hypothetical protein
MVAWPELFSPELDGILEDIRLEMAEREILKAGGMKKKLYNSNSGRLRFMPPKKLTKSQRREAEQKFAYYVERAEMFGRDVSTQAKRQPYWMNAVRAVTLDVERFKKRRLQSISRRFRYIKVMRKRQRAMMPVRKMAFRQLPL